MFRASNTPDFRLDIPDPNVKLRNIRIYVEPKNWFTRFIWRWIRYSSITATWEEEPLPKIYTGGK